MTRACVALVLGGATACTSILGSFDVTSETTGNDAGDSQAPDVVDSGGQDVQPDAPSNFLTGATQVSGGARHTCALVGTDVYCWGDNTDGQLAQNPGVMRSIKPLKVPLTSPIAAISAGAFHTCAITMTKDLICWGANDVGECGAGDTMNPAPPRPVTPTTTGLTWNVVSAGENSTCGGTESGGVYCWGDNSKGQSGSVGAGPITKPTNAGAEKMAYATIGVASAHSCGATTTTAHCWGSEFHGENGDGLANNSSAVGNDVMNLSGVHQIVTGGSHTCVRNASDQIQCWGDDSLGQLGIVADGGSQQLLPGAAIPGGPYQALAARNDFTCFIASVGGGSKVACVGANDTGELGRGGTTDMSPHNDVQPVISPTDMGNVPLVATAITTGREHACAIITGGGIVCWGNGADGQLGDGTMGGGARTTPVHVTKP